MTHRVIVVGAGAAGAALAARLSDESGIEVTLIEAGAAGPTPASLVDGGSLPAALPDHAANWAFAAELRPGRHTIVPRGRILGGSTTINGGYFVRATPADFASWAEAGGDAWAYEHALPILAAFEHDLDFGCEPGHGTNGPIRVQRPAQHGTLTTAFHHAARELGFHEEPDKNAYASGDDQRAAPGVGAIPSNIIDGARINTAEAYLRPRKHLTNLTVIGDTRVLRLQFAEAPQGDTHHDAPTRVTGVITDRGIFEADEIVLCAGAVITPQLLMLSGIGPRDHLESHGIRVVADLPVGEHFSDHPNIAVAWRPKRPLHDDDDRFAFPTALNFDSSGNAGHYPQGDLEILLVTKPTSLLFSTYEPQTDAATSDAALEMQMLVALQAPSSRGRLSLQSDDPLDSPRIEYHHLSTADDRARMRIGVRTAARILQSDAFAQLFAGFTGHGDAPLDAATLASDAALDEWIAAHHSTAIHLSGTAPMGAVTDGTGRVHGIGGLRVADTSILPRVPSRGPFNTAVFIGELIARQMLAERNAS